MKHLRKKKKILKNNNEKKINQLFNNYSILPFFNYKNLLNII